MAIASRILGLDTRRTSVVTFRFRPSLFPVEIICRNQKTWLGASHNRFVHYGNRKIYCSCWELNPDSPFALSAAWLSYGASHVTRFVSHDENKLQEGEMLHKRSTGGSSYWLIVFSRSRQWIVAITPAWCQWRWTSQFYKQRLHSSGTSYCH